MGREDFDGWYNGLPEGWRSQMISRALAVAVFEDGSRLWLEPGRLTPVSSDGGMAAAAAQKISDVQIGVALDSGEIETVAGGEKNE